MSRIPIRVSLDSANVPALSFASGPTVISVKEGLAKLRNDIKPSDVPWELTEPQLLFAENMMPIARGISSITYLTKVAGAIGVNTFKKAGLYRANSSTVGYWAVTTDGKLMTCPVGGINWADQTEVAWPGNWEISAAKINGVTYFYISFYGCYKFNADGTISPVTLTGLITSGIKGIAAAVGRLFAYSSTFLHYCSEVDILDFTPSLVTGAGSTQIQYARGDIMLIEGTSFGLFIYAQENVVSCQETGNIAAPYLFTEVENSAGVTDSEMIASAPGLDAVYAFGAGGLQLSSVRVAVPIFPEISDFMASRVIEEYDFNLHKITKVPLASRMRVKIAYVCSRHLVISYGVSSLTQMLVYDSALRRWGKLRTPHVDVFTISEALTSSDYLQYDELVVAADSLVIPASEAKSQVQARLSNQETFGVLRADGRVDVVEFGPADETILVTNETSQAVAVFGRIQLRRGRDCSLQEVQIEGLYSGEFSYVGDAVTVRGSSWLPTVELYQDSYDSESMTGQFFGSEVGANHRVHIEGAFDITGLTVMLVPDGVAR